MIPFSGADPGIFEGGRSFLFHSSSLLLFLSCLPPLFLPLEAGPLKPARRSGERCKLPQYGAWRSPGENEFGIL